MASLLNFLKPVGGYQRLEPSPTVQRAYTFKPSLFLCLIFIFFPIRASGPPAPILAAQVLSLRKSPT